MLRKMKNTIATIISVAILVGSVPTAASASTHNVLTCEKTSLGQINAISARNPDSSFSTVDLKKSVDKNARFKVMSDIALDSSGTASGEITTTGGSVSYETTVSQDADYVAFLKFTKAEDCELTVNVSDGTTGNIKTTDTCNYPTSSYQQVRVKASRIGTHDTPLTETLPDGY
jgi:hypothetical protein